MQALVGSLLTASGVTSSLYGLRGHVFTFHFRRLHRSPNPGSNVECEDVTPLTLLYYNHKNTGRPPRSEQHGAPEGTPLDPKDFTSRYMDVDFRPEFPFGFGLGYTTFTFGPTQAPAVVRAADGVRVRATVTNTGKHRGSATAQLYIHFSCGTATRPVRELKAFRRISLAPAETAEVVFDLTFDDLAAWSAEMKWGVEPRPVQVWIASDSTCADAVPACIQIQ